MEEQLKELCSALLMECEFVFKEAERLKLLDNDWFIEWQDKLNEISVAYYDEVNN